MNKKLFYELAKANGINEIELRISRSTSISVSSFNGVIDNHQISDSKSISARGIVNNKFGFATTTIDDKETPELLVKTILNTGKYIEKEEDAILFAGSKKYAKRKGFNKELKEIPLEKKLSHFDSMYKFAKEFDPRIENVEIGYDELESYFDASNSLGINIKDKSNYYVYSMYVTVRDGEEVVNSYDSFIAEKFEEFDPIALAKKICEKAIAKLHPIVCKSGKYKVLLDKKVFATFLNSFISNLSAESVQKKTSRLAGKLNEQVTSKKLTIMERPVDKNIYFTSHDTEFVATYNKTLVKNGTLLTYLYNLETAKKDGVESTGNGYGSVARISTGTNHLWVKKGKHSFDELVDRVNKGIYITQIMGLHAGMNPTSGDFSLQAQGFMIEDGKITNSLSQIVLAGNLFDMFLNVQEVGSDIELLNGGTEVPSVVFKKLQVSGK